MVNKKGKKKKIVFKRADGARRGVVEVGVRRLLVYAAAYTRQAATLCVRSSADRPVAEATEFSNTPA